MSANLCIYGTERKVYRHTFSIDSGQNDHCYEVYQSATHSTTCARVADQEWVGGYMILADTVYEKAVCARSAR